MKKQGLYFVDSNIDETGSGISKKVSSQLETFKKLGVDIKIVDIKKTNKVFKLISRLPILPSYFSFFNLKRFDQFNFRDFDFIYIRKPLIDRYFIVFLKKIKIKNSSIKIILEVPTYPYDKEFKGLKNAPLLIKESINRKSLKKYVDRIVTYSLHDEIFEIPTIKIVNGINFGEVRKRNPIVNKLTGVNVIAVATMADYHGYDRFIKGLNEYYNCTPDKEVFFHLVGDGKQLNLYKKLTRKYGLEKYVVFHGAKSNEDLNNLYDSCDLAVETLGCHRKDLYLSSSLKSREYLAKGLPIISSCKIDILSNSWEYVLYIEPDESIVNINKVMNFFEKVYPDHESENRIADEIRVFAENKCDIKDSLRPIKDYLCSK